MSTEPNPSGIIDIEVNPDGLDYITPDGRRFADVDMLLTPEAHERIRTGYQCVRCQERFFHAWPEMCQMCGMPVASEQRRIIEQEFVGQVKLPPVGITSDEIRRGEEEYLRKIKELRR